MKMNSKIVSILVICNVLALMIAYGPPFIVVGVFDKHAIRTCVGPIILVLVVFVSVLSRIIIWAMRIELKKKQFIANIGAWGVSAFGIAANVCFVEGLLKGASVRPYLNSIGVGAICLAWYSVYMGLKKISKGNSGTAVGQSIKGADKVN
jgi:hypothetical protein